MDKIRDISINEAVLHVLDNNSDKPILNHYKLELNEEVYKFIYSHIERVLKDDNLKYALFKNKDFNVKSVSQQYLNGQMDLIEASNVIANELFNIMKGTASIPSCDLFIVSFNTEYGPMVGILKVDYVKHYTHKIDVIDNAVGINIAPIATGLPTTKKIQKAAFITPIRKGNSYDLLVLDKGLITKDSEYGSNYFTDILLGCTLIENDRDKTRTFLNAVEVWTRSNFNNEAVRAEKVRTTVKEKLKENDEINIYSLAAEIIPFEETRKSFIAYMQQHDLEEIPVDKEYLEKKLSKLKIKVSSDIDLNITEEAYKDINKFEIKDNGDGSIHMIIKFVDNYVEK